MESCALFSGVISREMLAVFSGYWTTDKVGNVGCYEKKTHPWKLVWRNQSDPSEIECWNQNSKGNVCRSGEASTGIQSNNHHQTPFPPHGMHILTLQVPIVTNINFLLLMIPIQCQEVRLWELIKWSPKRKCFDLLSNSLDSFFKELYRDHWGEFVWGYWDLKG